MPQENQAYLEMLSAAQKRLQGRDASSLAKNAGVMFSASSFSFYSLNRLCEIDYPSCECKTKSDPWLHLVTLHYLDLADGYPVSLDPMPFGELKDGVIRGVKFDHSVESNLRQILCDKTPDEIVASLKALNADFIPSKADLCAILPFFPKYPLILNIWYADDEFPVSGKLFVTRSADHYLTVEDAVTVGGITLTALNTKLANNPKMFIFA